MLSDWKRVQGFICCERFERRSHFKSRLSLVVQVKVVLNRTVIVDSDWHFDNLCGSHLQCQSGLCHVSWWCYTLVIDLIGQIRRDVIGLLIYLLCKWEFVKPCYFDFTILWRHLENHLYNNALKQRFKSEAHSLSLTSKGLSLFHRGNTSAKLVEIPLEWALRTDELCLCIDGKIASLNYSYRLLR